MRGRQRLLEILQSSCPVVPDSDHDQTNLFRSESFQALLLRMVRSRLVRDELFGKPSAQTPSERLLHENREAFLLEVVVVGEGLGD
jgi:hypothetical protein